MNCQISSVRPQIIVSLFQFLVENKDINLRIQRADVADSLSAALLRDRALTLMQRALNTQSQPKLDPIAAFLKDAYAAHGKSDALHSCANFRRWLHLKTGQSKIRDALKQIKGWGDKTAALFVRNLAIIEESPDLTARFWSDIDVREDEVELPVDAVILKVFECLVPHVPRGLNNYSKINNYLREELGYSSPEMLIWDDLWFWGFITQRSESKARGGARKFGWNEGKYWSIPHAPRDPVEIDDISERARGFVDILEMKT